MEKPNQQQALMIASAIPNDKTGNVQRLIYANQKNMDYSALDFEKATITETKLKAKVATELSDVMTYLGHQQRSGDSSTGVYDATLNMVKYLALANGDIRLDNVNDYIKEAVDTVSKAYKIEHGSFYSFNTSRQNINNQDALALANYMREQATQYYGKNTSPEELMLAMDRNPFYVTMDESGMVNVVDSLGQIRWQEPFTSTLMGAARANGRATSRQIEENRKMKSPVYAGGLVTPGSVFTGNLNEQES